MTKKNQNDKLRAAFLSEGIGLTVKDCKMVGPDAGMIDRGKNTKVYNSEMYATEKFQKKWWEHTWIQVIMLLGAIASVVALILFFMNNDKQEIILDLPSPNQSISSPLLVSGKAIGPWFFEADFPMQLVDSDGEIISSGIAHAKSEWMTTNLVEFEGTLNFYTEKEFGKLVLKKDNPSGLPENDKSYSVPVKFQEANQEDFIENYIRENISQLNPTSPVLGGTWYVLDIEFSTENTVKVYCEDGHIQSIFTANYFINKDNEIVFSNILVC